MLTLAQRRLIQAIYAVHEGKQHIDSLKDLIEDLNIEPTGNPAGFQDEQGNTVIHLVCLLQNPELLAHFLQDSRFKTALFFQNNDGFTPLHIICQKGLVAPPAPAEESSSKAPSLIQRVQSLLIQTPTKSADDAAAPLLSFSTMSTSPSATSATGEAPLSALVSMKAVNRSDYTSFTGYEKPEYEEAGNTFQDISLAEPVSSSLSSSSSLTTILTPVDKTKQLLALLLACQHSSYFRHIMCVNIQEENALHLACRHYGDDPEFIKSLLDNIINSSFGLTQQNKFKQTPLHVACCHGNFPVIKMMLDASAQAILANTTEPTSSVEINPLLNTHIGAIRTTAITSDLASKKKTAETAMKGSAGSFVATSYGGLGGMFLGALLTPISGPLGIGIFLGSFLVLEVGPVASLAAFVGSSIATAVYNGRKCNLMHFIIMENTADVFRSFCQYLPVQLLLDFAERSSVRKALIERIAKDKTYGMTVLEFDRIIQQEACFHYMTKYLVEKQTQLEAGSISAENLESRLSDYCQIIAQLTRFFTQHQEQTPTNEQLKSFIDTYIDGADGQSATSSIRQTQSGFWKGYGSKDRYLSEYRPKILAADVPRLCRRMRECISTCQAISVNDRATAAQKAIATRVIAAMTGTGASQVPLVNTATATTTRSTPTQ